MNLRLRTRDNLLYNLMENFNSVGIVRGLTTVDLDVIEKTYNHGGVFIGERRIMSQDLTIRIDINEQTDDEYRDNYNNICYYASACEYIECTSNNIRTKVELKSITETPDNPTGSMLRGGIIDLIFRQLTPFWEDLTAQTDTKTGTSLTFVINNSGFIDCPPVFTITASALCILIKIYISSPVRGIEIQDVNFGESATLDEYVIDCENGTVVLGDGEYNREDRIRGGSGFFDFPVGTFTLNAEFSVSCQCDISWRRRYYI